MIKRIKYIPLIAIIVLFSSCSFKSRTTPYIHIVNSAINSATPVGKKVLKMAHKMAYNRSVVIRGSCWNYIDVIYKKAGFKGYKNSRIVFNSNKGGPYIEVNMIQSGDWIYYINHSYHNVEHSAIFVAWLNYSQKKALMLSYSGKGRVPARYKVYNLSSVYRIKRGRL